MLQAFNVARATVPHCACVCYVSPAPSSLRSVRKRTEGEEANAKRLPPDRASSLVRRLRSLVRVSSHSPPLLTLLSGPCFISNSCSRFSHLLSTHVSLFRFPLILILFSYLPLYLWPPFFPRVVSPASPRFSSDSVSRPFFSPSLSFSRPPSYSHTPWSRHGSARRKKFSGVWFSQSHPFDAQINRGYERWLFFHLQGVYGFFKINFFAVRDQIYSSLILPIT